MMNKNNAKMKLNFRNRTMALVISFILMTPAIFAQELYVVIDFMKVQPENLSDYLENEQEIWKPMHQERINRGIILGWFFYAVEFSGTSDEYNYVTITLYDNPNNIENPWTADILEKVHPGVQMDKILRKTYSTRTKTSSGLFYSIAKAPDIPLASPAPYMEANFMYVESEKQAEYERMESELWLPIHDESIRSGRTSGWSLWSARYPRGTDHSYQYLTLNSFSEYCYIFELDFSIPFNSIHPDKDYEKIWEETNEIRNNVRSELWDLIDYVIK